jgi:hypothetical protein
LIPGTKSELTSERFQLWIDSVRNAPSIVRYKVRSIAELVADAGRRRAMRDAIQRHLGDTYAAAWLDEQKERDAGYGGLLVARRMLAAEIEALQRSKLGLSKALETMVLARGSATSELTAEKERKEAFEVELATKKTKVREKLRRLREEAERERLLGRRKRHKTRCSARRID